MPLRFERVVWAYFQEHVLQASNNPTENWGLLRIRKIENDKDYYSCPLEHRGLSWNVLLKYCEDLDSYGFSSSPSDADCEVSLFAFLPPNKRYKMNVIQCFRLSFVDGTGQDIWTSQIVENKFIARRQTCSGQRFVVPSERMSEIKEILEEGQSCFLRISFYDKHQCLQAPECRPVQAKPAPERSPVQAKPDPECSTVIAENDWAELSQQFKSLLNDKQNCDISLVVKGRTFGAHKAVLMARSPVFDRMFQSNMIEQRTGKVEIPDCDPGAFEVYLQFLYSGTFQGITVDNVSSLYYIAAKYDSMSLARECLKLMKRSLSVETYSSFVSSVLLVSDPEPGFLEVCVQYLANHFEQISESAEWKAFFQANPLQVNELLIKVFKVMAISKK